MAFNCSHRIILVGVLFIEILGFRGHRNHKVEPLLPPLILTNTQTHTHRGTQDEWNWQGNQGESNPIPRRLFRRENQRSLRMPKMPFLTHSHTHSHSYTHSICQSLMMWCFAASSQGQQLLAITYTEIRTCCYCCCSFCCLICPLLPLWCLPFWWPIWADRIFIYLHI